MARHVYAVVGDDRHSLLCKATLHRYASIRKPHPASNPASKAAKSKTIFTGSATSYEVDIEQAQKACAAAESVSSSLSSIEWPKSLGPEIDVVVSTVEKQGTIEASNEPATSRKIRVPGARTCNVETPREATKLTHSKQERLAFSKRLQRMVEKQRSNALVQARPLHCDGELLRELQENVTKERPRAVFERILEFCQPQFRNNVIQGVLAALHDCIVQLPLVLGRRFAGRLQDLVLQDAIKQEQAQILCMQKVAALSDAHAKHMQCIESKQLKIKEIKSLKATTWDDDVNAKLAELQKELAPHTNRMSELKKQEIIEQSAISRNLSEFNKLQGFCVGNIVDERAHQRVQEQLINIGTSKWRSARETQVPVEEQIATIQRQIREHQQQKQEAEQQRHQQQQKISQLESEVGDALAEQQRTTADMESQQRDLHRVQTAALRMQEVVGATKRIKEHLCQVESYIYGSQCL